MSSAWDIASLLLKVLSAAAAITGVALPVLDALNVKLVALTRGQLVITTATFVAAAVVLGMADYIISKRKEAPKGLASAKVPREISIEAGGDITGSFNTTIEQKIGSLTIAAGDPPEERARKTRLVRLGPWMTASVLLIQRLNRIPLSIASPPQTRRSRPPQARLGAAVIAS